CFGYSVPLSMPMKYFSEAYSNLWLRIMALMLLGVSVVSYQIYGPYYSPDTVNYFHFASNLFSHSFWTEYYSPFYPFLLYGMKFLLVISLFTASNFLILIQYGLGLFFLFKLAKVFSESQWFNLNSRISLTLLFLISYHTWWSFRIITWAHADGTFYTFLLAWSFFLAKFF